MKKQIDYITKEKYAEVLSRFGKGMVDIEKELKKVKPGSVVVNNKLRKVIIK